MANDVLVIAADTALRRSLEFLFEAEGLAVSSRDHVPAAKRCAGERCGCVVVDESSLGAGAEGWRRLSGLAEAIVLLIDRAGDPPGNVAVRTVEKPLAGPELVETVKALLPVHDATA